MSNPADEKNQEGRKISETARKEEETLRFWEENKIFEKTLAKTRGKKPYVFYDGPPFATGLPHYGHTVPGTVKDIIPRYQTMKGRYVRRVWGWDCHGMPVENLIENELGFKGKKDIENYGIEKFNKAAKDSVFRYDKEWKAFIPRVGRWVDMENNYQTMDAEYTESIWWAFSELYKKGLIYKGYKSMLICPRDETTLSATEVADGYKDITDISVTAKFELVDEPGTYVLAWTTTPWTLPGNVALAVGEHITYIKARIPNDEAIYLIAKDRAEHVFKEGFTIQKEYKGGELVGKSYKPVFDYFINSNIENRDNGWKIYSGDFVTTESGTGVVHIAPAFGEDDMELGKKYSLPFVQHVSFDGHFTSEVKDFPGRLAKPKENPQETDIEIIKYLAGKGTLFSKEKIVHSYPHCWRCDTPLLNYATTSWFVKVTELKKKLLSENKKISWVPKHIKDGRFKNWLSGARDWSISRTRFWGAPFPVWECATCNERKVVSSLSELRKSAKVSGNTYFVMRHGQSETNVKRIVSYNRNAHHLTEKGKRDVVKTAKKLAKAGITKIYASDITRAKETAELVAETIGIPKEAIIYDARLREINTGKFNEMSVEEYHNFFANLQEKFTKRPPDGEHLIDVRKRALDFVYEMERTHKGETLLFVTHEYPGWMMMRGSNGETIAEMAAFKKTHDEYPELAQALSLKFAPIPHDDDYMVDFHRPYIDEIELGCKCGGDMKRIPDVFDCWFESGSMPFAQFAYPYKGKADFKKNFPAEFIAEGLDQTRGWFFTLLVIATGLFGKAPYKNVVVNGLVLAEDGRKMSKKLKNYPEPGAMINKYGADALRYYLVSSPVVRGEDLRFSETGLDDVYKKIILRLSNVLSFYELYKDTTAPHNKSKHILDRWVLSRLAQTHREVEKGLEAYEIDAAARPIGLFVDDLSTWYVRRSRERFKGLDTSDRKAVQATLRYILLELSKTIAPFMPFIAEEVYQSVHKKGDQKSVHLAAWPKGMRGDQALVKKMAAVRAIVSQALEARAKAGLKVRQPLASLMVGKGSIPKDEQLLTIIREEVNVKEILFAEGVAQPALDIHITPELKEEGKFRDILRQIQDARKDAGLTPSAKVGLLVDGGVGEKEIFEKYKSEFQRVAALSGIDFGKIEGGVLVKVDGSEFKVAFKER